MATAPPRIFSRQRRIAAWTRALARQSGRDAARFILQDMVEDVLERLEFLRLEPARALVIGDLSGTLALSLRGGGISVAEGDVRTLDEEKPLPDQYDLVVSLASLERVNDLPGAFIHIRQGLRTGGMLIASIVGAGSLPVLRGAMLAAEPDRTAARMHPMIDSAVAAALLQRAGFARQVVDGRTLEVAYPSLDRLVADLRDQGLTSALAKPAPALNKEAIRRARASFAAASDGTGPTLEKFEILTLTGWKD